MATHNNPMMNSLVCERSKVYSEEKNDRKTEANKFMPRAFPLFFNNPTNLSTFDSGKLKIGGQMDLKNISLNPQINIKRENKNNQPKEKPETYNSYNSSMIGFSEPALSSLAALSNYQFSESKSSDLKLKMKIFALHKLPFLIKDLQPKRILKLFLIFTKIMLANKIPKEKIKLVKQEKLIISEMVKVGLKKKIKAK